MMFVSEEKRSHGRVLCVVCCGGVKDICMVGLSEIFTPPPPPTTKQHRTTVNKTRSRANTINKQLNMYTFNFG